MAQQRFFSKLRKNEAGTSSVEYGVILAMIVLVVIVAIEGLAGQTISMWEDVQTKSDNAINGN